MADLHSDEEVTKADKIQSGRSFGSALSELRRSVKSLVQSEGALARAELKESFSNLSRDLILEGVFGSLLVLSAISFLVFLILGLGRLLDNNYWLSALIVSAVLGFLGGGMAYRGFQKIKNSDLTLPRTRKIFQKGSKLHNVLEPYTVGESKGRRVS